MACGAGLIDNLKQMKLASNAKFLLVWSPWSTLLRPVSPGNHPGRLEQIPFL